MKRFRWIGLVLLPVAVYVLATVLALFYVGRQQTGDLRDISSLLTLLKFPNPWVQAAAIEKLGYSNNLRAVEPLLALHAREPALRGTIVDALRALNDPRAIPAMLSSVEYGAPPERDFAYYGLSRFTDDPRVRRLLIAHAQGNDQRAIELLAGVEDAQARATLWRIARDRTKEGYLRAEALQAAVRDFHDTPGLLALLRDADLLVRVAAAEALGHLRDDRATAALLPGLNSKDSAFQLACAEALGEIADPGLLPRLRPFLEKEMGVGQPMLALLCRYPRPDDLALLSRLLEGYDSLMVRRAVWALGALETDAARDKLLALANNPDHPAYEEAVLALARSTHPTAVRRAKLILLAAPDFTEIDASDVIAAMLARDTLTTADLLELLQDPDVENVRYEVACALNRHPRRDPRLLPVLVSSLVTGTSYTSDTDAVAGALRPFTSAATRALVKALSTAPNPSYVIEVLAALDDPAAAPAILARLRDPDPYIRMAACRASGRLRLSAAVPALRDGLGDTEGEVRAAAATALCQLGDRASAGAILTVAREHGGTDARLLEALGALGDPRAVDVLLPYLDHDHEMLRAAAMTALVKLPPDARAIPSLAFNLTRQLGGGAYEQQAAFQALSRCSDPGVAQRLARFRAAQRESDRLAINDYTCNLPWRLQAIDACREARDLRAVLPLMYALKDPQAEIRAAAAQALTALTGQSLGADHRRWVAWWLKAHPGPVKS